MMKAIYAAAMLAAAGLCRADLIIFNDKLELGGPHVEVLSRSNDQLKVKVRWGTVTIDAKRVASIRIDFKERVAKMTEEGRDTCKALMELAELCEQSQMPDEAGQAYALALRKQNAPEEVLRRLAQVFEDRKMWPEAKNAYDRLLATNPADEHLQKKANLCAGMAKDAPAIKIDTEDPNTKPQPVVEEPDPAEEPVKPVQPKAEAKGEDGFESNNQWRVEQWGNDATCEVVEQEGNKILSIVWAEKEKKDKVALRLTLDMDLTDKGKVTFDIYNDSEKPEGLCVAFNTLPGYQFFESSAFNAPVRKWESMSLNLQGKNFKCATTNWRYTAEIANRDNVKDIFLLIYNREVNGKMFIDNIRFHAAEAK